MRRGELWWAQIDEKRPVVLLSGVRDHEVAVMQIVAPATASQKRGFLIMAGDEAVDPDVRRRIIAGAGPVRAVGIEVWFGRSEGLAEDGVVRVVFPQEGTTFCTWGTSLRPEFLLGRIGVCSPEKLRELDTALELAEGRVATSRGSGPGVTGPMRTH